VCRNPLESGQCFSLRKREKGSFSKVVAIPSNRVNVSHLLSSLQFPYTSFCLCRNPLESGQCFSLKKSRIKPRNALKLFVAIPSNRVNVSHYLYANGKGIKGYFCRNPLESGQCFSLTGLLRRMLRKKMKTTSQSPRIGSMFLTS